MVKQRLTSLDVKAAVEEARAAVVGLRLVNVYDLSPKVYLMKFGHGERKAYLIYESGVRLHLTTYSREKPKVPSQFTLKLRKHVRSWRLDGIEQLGTDRVVDMRFGTGEQSYHFVLELYGQGNFFLTDHRYSIMMLLRSQKSEDVRLAVRETYPVAHAKDFTPKSRTDILEALKAAADSDSLRVAMPLSAYGSTLVDHVLATCGLNGAEKKRVWSDDMERIADTVCGVCAAIDPLFTQPMPPGGVTIQFGTPAAAAAAHAMSPEEAAQAFPNPPTDEFWPAGCERFLDRSRIVNFQRYASYSEGVDNCFRATEQDKINTHNEKKEQVVLSKREKFLRDHQRRIDGLVAEQERHQRLGDLIVLNVEDVDNAINLINDVLATGISWDHLGSLVRQRQAEGTHPIANIIHELKLYKNCISLLLSQDCADDEDLEDADLAPVVVDVDIGLSAFANASKYHTQKKTVAKKLEKTVEATDRAAEAASKTGERMAKKVQEKKDITAIRQPLWFEKYQWFLTSQGHLAVSGHDPQQSEILVKRYLEPLDIFINGDQTGCQPFIVKNTSKGNVALPSVEEAGIMCIARTEAWRKQPVSAWWCQGSQVSKRGVAGDHLPVGAFAVRGQKNYMAAMQLQLAVAVLFRSSTPRPTPQCDESSIAYISVSEECATADADAEAAMAQRQHSSTDYESEERVGSNDTDLSSPTRDVAAGFPATGPNRSAQLRHLRRGHGSAKSSASPSGVNSSAPSGAASAAGDSVAESDTTISLTSTRTPVSAAQVKDQRSRSSSAASGSSAAAMAGQSARARNKLQRIKKKYAEQDEEERAQAMAIIGNPISKVHQQLLQDETREGEEESDDDEDLPEGELAASRNRVKFAAPSPDDVVDATEDAMEREHSLINQRQTSFEDDTTRLLEKMRQEMATIFPYLDGKPAEGCDVSDIIVVCAPYASVRHYAVKARISPGTEKKGAAAKALLQAFSDEIARSVPAAAGSAKLLSHDGIVAQLVGPLKPHLAEVSQAKKPTDMSARAKAREKREQAEREAAERMREERRRRLAERAAAAAVHVDPAAA